MEDSENIIPSPQIIKPGQTYLCLNSDDGTKLEVDLVMFREKGEQVKYLAVSFTDANQNKASISLNEESFDTIKLFFKELDWKG